MTSVGVKPSYIQKSCQFHILWGAYEYKGQREREHTNADNSHYKQVQLQKKNIGEAEMRKRKIWGLVKDKAIRHLQGKGKREKRLHEERKGKKK